ncbi:extracellular solute-binding protein [Haloarculaceae archaeon H-GB2-1]|nr:extracellular solute-binding protein [Haloarculaceae archaeon H-GB11]MEA5408366.1 extracellular solute-binding protein [Haloarculaceae archaeon H-GB2-1]
MSRRTVLRGVGGLAATGLAGCLGSGTEQPVRVLSAGSLHKSFTQGLADAAPPELTVESHGSRKAAQMVAEQQRDPDVLALADTDLFSSILSTPWHATFASNAVVLAYDPDSDRGARVADAERWYEPLLESAFALGRTDPNLDPLGYRSLFALSLASDHYDVANLRERVVSPEQIYPETQLLAQFETGGLDAAFVYRNMAVERDYPFVDLPTALDLSDPALADHYASASVELPDGTTVTGAPIQYGATLRSDGERAASVFETLVESATDYLEPYGFAVRDAHPTYEGDVPDRFND